MPSKPPPLPSASAGSNRINWPAILASAAVSFALVVAIVAWIVTHPSKRAGATESLPVAALTASVQTPNPYSLERIVELPAPLPAPGIETIPAVYQANRPKRSDHSILLIEDTPPSLPPPVPPKPRTDPLPADQAAAPEPAGETYGTQVLFRNNQEAAAELAKRDHKLLFVMHISGNFEESCFT